MGLKYSWIWKPIPYVVYLSSSHSLLYIEEGCLLCQPVACNLKPPFLDYIELSLPPRSLPRPGSDACHRTIWIVQKRRS
jgi:hypothetical protein